MAYDLLILERNDAGVATMTLNRPETLNSYTPALEVEMREATAEVADDTDVRALIVTGAGRAFSAGGDVTGMQKGGHWDLPPSAREARFQGLGQVVTTLHGMAKPTIAMINGFAVGAGCNLAMACDQRIASDKARFGLAFINVALGDDMGGAWMLPRLVGLGRAMELLQTGAIIDAEEALRIGLVNRVVPHDELERETYALAEQLARGPSHAHGLMKRMVYRGMESSFQELLDFEATHQADEMDHPDHLEGAAAFLEKRQAAYR